VLQPSRPVLMVPIIRYRNDTSMFSPSEVKNRVEAGRDGGLGDMGQSDSSVLSGDFFPSVGQVTQLFIFRRFGVRKWDIPLGMKGNWPETKEGKESPSWSRIVFLSFG
jgi:hypothetical protein